MLIIAMVFAAMVKNGVVDTAAMATGKTPPSHAYRMARLKAEQAMAAADPSKVRTSPVDLRGGAKMVAKHWYLDACEDVDHWRANRRSTRPERKAARQARKDKRARVIREWAEKHLPDDADKAGGRTAGEQPGGAGAGAEPQPGAATAGTGNSTTGKPTSGAAGAAAEDDVIDAEVVDDPATERPAAGSSRRTAGGSWKRRGRSAGAGGWSAGRPAPARYTARDVTSKERAVVLYLQEGRRHAGDVPLSVRRIVLAALITEAGYIPDMDAVDRMSGEQVDEALRALIARLRHPAAAAP
jgi:hypothetical protein